MSDELCNFFDIRNLKNVQKEIFKNIWHIKNSERWIMQQLQIYPQTFWWDRYNAWHAIRTIRAEALGSIAQQKNKEEKEAWGKHKKKLFGAQEKRD